jgi:hypothetical protein
MEIQMTLDEKLLDFRNLVLNTSDLIRDWCDDMISFKSKLDNNEITKAQFLELLAERKNHGPQLGAMTQDSYHQQNIINLYVELEALAV